MKRAFTIIIALWAVLATMSAHAIELTKAPTTDAEWTEFLDILSEVESNATDGLKTMDRGTYSYGRLQIKQPYLTDSRLNYTLEQVRTSKDISYAVAKAYLVRYAASYTKRTGKQATFEVLARIHNGGPKGAERNTTLPYLEKVKAKL